jgi:hypothetical protein
MIIKRMDSKQEEMAELTALLKGKSPMARIPPCPVVDFPLTYYSLFHIVNPS